MDLIKEAKKSNKEAYLSLIDKYNYIFYKVSRIYFKLDKDVSDSLKKALSNAYYGITNIKTEEDFLCSAIKEIKNISENKIKHNFEPESEESLLKNAKYRMYKSDSAIEKCMNILDDNNSKLISLLYYYVNLDFKKISKITHLSKSEIKGKLTDIEPKLYDIFAMMLNS